MAAPTVTSAQLDKSAYAPGDKMTLTVHYVTGASGSQQSLTVTFTVTDNTTGQASAPATAQATINVPSDAYTKAVTDTLNHTWTVVSDDGATLVATATA